MKKTIIGLLIISLFLVGCIELEESFDNFEDSVEEVFEDDIPQSSAELENKTEIIEEDPPVEEQKKVSEEETTEMNIEDLVSLFGDSSKLTDLQKESKFNEIKEKTIRTTIRADDVSQASLSSQYVVKQMADMFSCNAKAFFPKEEKDKLLTVNTGDKITFEGKLVEYEFGFASCITFSKSKLLNIEAGSGTKSPYEEQKEAYEELKEKVSEASSATSKVDECTKACAGEDYSMPAVRDVWYNACYEIYYYAGEEALDEQIADCGK